MNFPEDLKYAKSHEWVKTLEDGTVLVGVSDYAQDALGDLVFVNLPEAGWRKKCSVLRILMDISLCHTILSYR